MFGKKKILTQSIDKNRSVSTEKEISNSYSGDDSKFIYYDKSDQFISQLEIYVKPNNYPDKKVLVIINNEADFNKLNEQIKESFKSISEFKNVAGLGVENLYKVQNESRMNLPKNGCINGYLKSGDIIYCDIISDEYWIKTYFKIISYKYRKIIKLEYKLQKKLKFKQIKNILLKAGIELFWNELKKNTLDNTYNYYVKQIKLYNKKNKKSQTGFEFTDLNNKLKCLDSKIEIMVNLKFGIFEELVHEQLMSINLNKNEQNYLRLNEYSNLNFEELLASKKFEPELGAVQDISREFLKSQYNDLNSSFIFYNIKKKETVDEYMYNMINMSNSYEQEIEDDEDDDLDFEGDTSFGKFYSEDASKFFGNITKIKKTNKNYLKRHNKYDSNMIIVAPFLFKLVTVSNKKLFNETNNKNIFKTFAHQNLNDNKNRRGKEDINNFFVLPFSFDNDNNLLKNNDIEDADYELNIDTNNKPFLNNIIDEDNLNNIYNKNKKEEKRYSVKFNDVMSQKTSRRSLLTVMRLSKQSNCCNDLYNCFSQIEFIQKLKITYKNYISKKIMEKIIIPESRDYENIDKEFLIFLNKKENEEDNSLIVKNKKLIIFLFIFFFYYVLIMLKNNFEIIDLFI